MTKTGDEVKIIKILDTDGDDISSSSDMGKYIGRVGKIIDIKGLNAFYDHYVELTDGRKDYFNRDELELYNNISSFEF